MVVGVALVAALVGAVWVVTTIGDPRYASLPGRPFPPNGYVRNPFSSDTADIFSAAEADGVKRDLLEDGRVELEAFEKGDVDALSRARTGNALVKVQEIVARNNAQGIAEREQIHVDRIVVGRLANPNDASGRATWCIEESGSSTITYFRKTTGATIRMQALSFDNRFWLVLVGQRYLIADVEVR